MRFDWYQVTIPERDDEEVGPALALSLGAVLVRLPKGRLGYSRGVTVQRGEDVLATVLEGSARPGEVHVIVTGQSCDEVVPVVRRLWPAHRVSRVDSSLDFAADFDVLDGVALDFARRNALKSSITTDTDGGATRYVGSSASEVRVRVYKKTEQLLALHPERAADIPRGIVRAELVARPGKREAKEAAATLEPVSVWGLGGWTQAFALEVLTLEAERTITHFRRPSDWARSVAWMGRQYGPPAQRRLEEVGRDQVVAEVLAALGLDAGHTLGEEEGQGAA